MKKKKRQEFPLTAILAGIVVVLVIVLFIVVRMFLDRANLEYEQSQMQAETQVQEDGTIERQTEEKKSGQAAGNTDKKNAVDTDRESDTGSDTDMKDTDMKSEDAMHAENETDMQSESSAAESEQSDTEPGTQESEDGMISITVEEIEIPETGTSENEASESETSQEKLVVAIDPGHQGSWVDMSDKEPNAPGSSVMKTKATVGTSGRFSGKHEYELNLEVSLLLRDELEDRGYEVILTREDHDKAISNSERALMAYEEGGDIYVRIHANGADSSSARGALAMVPSPQNQYVGHLAQDSYLLGQCILDAYCSKASFDSLGIQYYDNMTGINWSRIPVMILEMGFMTNESDDLRMADPQTQILMAEGVADGIDDYFEQKGLREEKADPEDQAKINTAFEILGEAFLYPAADAGETWAVSMKDLTTHASDDMNGDEPMKAASLIKVFIMAAIYDRVCYPSSPERYIPYPEAYEGELKQLITDMITVSDNTAANTLVKTLGGGDAAAGMAVVNQYCEENGYTNTSMGRLFLEANPSGDNYTSANDCRNLLERIYEGTCVNAEASAKMYAYLKQQTRRGKIPAGLSGTGAEVANKTGELGGEYGDYVENDIAVIEENGKAFVLCILSKDVQDCGTARQKVADIAGEVYRQQ